MSLVFLAYEIPGQTGSRTDAWLGGPSIQTVCHTCFCLLHTFSQTHNTLYTLLQGAQIIKSAYCIDTTEASQSCIHCCESRGLLPVSCLGQVSNKCCLYINVYIFILASFGLHANIVWVCLLFYVHAWGKLKYLLFKHFLGNLMNLE